MPETVTITPTEADALVAALYALRTIERRANNAALSLRTEAPTAMRLGRIEAESAIAIGLVFGVLSSAGSYLDCPNGKAGVRRWLDRDETATAPDA